MLQRRLPPVLRRRGAAAWDLRDRRLPLFGLLNRAGLVGAVEPSLYEAFRSDNLRPASATTKGRKRSEEQLDRLVWQLLWHNYPGLVERIIWAVLRGEDHYYSLAEKRRKPLWPPLLLSRVRGRKPALRQDELKRSIQRLMASGQVSQTGACRYRLTRYVLQDRVAVGVAKAKQWRRLDQADRPNICSGFCMDGRPGCGVPSVRDPAYN